MLAQKHDGRRILENGGGAGRSGSDGENLGQKQKVEGKRKPDVDARLRVMERFRDFSVRQTGMASHSQMEKITGKFA